MDRNENDKVTDRKRKTVRVDDEYMYALMKETPSDAYRMRDIVFKKIVIIIIALIHYVILVLLSAVYYFRYMAPRL